MRMDHNNRRSIKVLDQVRPLYTLLRDEKFFKIIILTDTSGGRTIEKADEQTIFGTMAIKSMASKIRACAELIHPKNKAHLIQANVDEVVVRGESVGPLLAAAAISPGVSNSLERLINNQDENKLWRIPVPLKYVGKTFGETARYLRDKSGVYCRPS